MESLTESTDSTRDYFTFTFHAMGSPCEITFEAASRARADAFHEWVRDWLGRFEADGSVFKPDSVVSRINQNAGREWVEITGLTRELTALSDWFHWRTHGVFDPSSAPVLRLWDYHTEDFTPPSVDEVNSALQLVGWKKVERRENALRLPRRGMALDFGGIGKEFAVDRVVEEATARGVRNILVNFGHDIRAHGHPPQGGPWIVGLEDPAKPGRCWSAIPLRNSAVCTSGAYLRYAQYGGERYGHIIDPRTGWPADTNCLAVHVTAPTCTEAGILATSAFILGREQGHAMIEQAFAVEGCIVTSDGAVRSRTFHAATDRELLTERRPA